MAKILNKSFVVTSAIISFIFTVIPESMLKVYTIIPESFFENSKKLLEYSTEINIIIIRILIIISVFVISFIVIALRKLCIRKICINGKNYKIQVEYGDILKVKNCKKVISFDECFITKIGNNPGEIKQDSVCGQYLTKYPIQDMQALINQAQIIPNRKKSQYQNKECYKSGTLVPRNDDLLLAFAKLNSNGNGYFSYNEYIECLSELWKEIDKHYGQKDVCITILGSGLTRILQLTQQELLDIIINSYKLSEYKIKKPYKLRIICKRREGFSLNKIGENI